MLTKTLALLLAAIALVIAASGAARVSVLNLAQPQTRAVDESPAAADSAALPATNHYEGSFISAGKDSFTFRDQDNTTQRAFSVDENATITRDATKAKLEDLRAGDWVKVTTETRFLIKEIATVIEASSQPKM